MDLKLSAAPQSNILPSAPQSTTPQSTTPQVATYNSPNAIQSAYGDQGTQTGYTSSSMAPIGVATNTPSPISQPSNVFSGNSVAPAGNVGSVKFGLNNSAYTPVDSTHLAPTGGISDAAAAYDKWFQGIQNRNLNSDTSTPAPTPTDSYMQQVFNASTYTPQEQAALQQYADATNRINQTTLAERRQIQALHDNGQMTTEQANSFGEESQRRADAQLADLALQQSSASLSLGVLGQLRGNNLTALQNLGDFYKPQTLSPGSSLVNAQGENFAQGNGASPQTIITTAQQLEQSAQAQGTLQYNADGSVNHQAYIQQAQQYYNTGALGGGSSIGGTQSSGGGSPLQGFTQQQDGSFVSPRGFSINPIEAQKISQLPGQFQDYVDGGPLGVAYINADRVPTTQQTAIMTAASKAGIPYLTGNEVQGVQAVDSILQNLTLMKQFANTALSSGVTGKLAGYTTNQIQAFFGSGKTVTDPATGNQVPIGVILKNFDQFKDNAGKAVTALAGGTGSGFRMSMPVIENAVSNLPTSKDNLESANGKIDDFTRLIMNQFSTNFPSAAGANPVAKTNSAAVTPQSSSGSIWNF